MKILTFRFTDLPSVDPIRLAFDPDVTPKQAFEMFNQVVRRDYTFLKKFHLAPSADGSSPQEAKEAFYRAYSACEADAELEISCRVMKTATASPLAKRGSGSTAWIEVDDSSMDQAAIARIKQKALLKRQQAEVQKNREKHSSASSLLSRLRRRKNPPKPTETAATAAGTGGSPQRHNDADEFDFLGALDYQAIALKTVEADAREEAKALLAKKAKLAAEQAATLNTALEQARAQLEADLLEAAKEAALEASSGSGKSHEAESDDGASLTAVASADIEEVGFSFEEDLLTCKRAQQRARYEHEAAMRAPKVGKEELTVSDDEVPASARKKLLEQQRQQQLMEQKFARLEKAQHEAQLRKARRKLGGDSVVANPMHAATTRKLEVNGSRKPAPAKLDLLKALTVEATLDTPRGSHRSSSRQGGSRRRSVHAFQATPGAKASAEGFRRATTVGRLRLSRGLTASPVTTFGGGWELSAAAQERIAAREQLKALELQKKLELAAAKAEGKPSSGRPRR